MLLRKTTPESRYNSLREKWLLAPFFTQIHHGKLLLHLHLSYSPRGQFGWGVWSCLPSVTVLLEASDAWVLVGYSNACNSSCAMDVILALSSTGVDNWGNATLLILTFKGKNIYVHYKAIYSFPMFSQWREKGMCWKTWLPVDTVE